MVDLDIGGVELTGWINDISYPPYGYANVDGKMVIVPEQAEIVKQIFADTLAGKSTHEIADELNKRGVATKKGGCWTPGTVSRTGRSGSITAVSWVTQRMRKET